LECQNPLGIARQRAKVVSKRRQAVWFVVGNIGSLLKLVARSPKHYIATGRQRALVTPRLQVNETTSRVVAGIMDLRINGIADRAKPANSQQLTSRAVATRRLVVS
jgi:hypothetical protein